MDKGKVIRDSFVVYRSFYDSIKVCPADIQLGLFRALFEYGLDQESPTFEDWSQRAIWSGIVPQLDANTKRFVNGCKGGKYGEKGGAPLGNLNAKKTTPSQPQNNPKTTPNVNDNANSNVNGNVVLPYSSKPFVDAWRDLVASPKWKKKTNTQLQKSADSLAKYPEEFGVELMNTATANGYQGVVFPNTPEVFETWKRQKTSNSKPVSTGEVITSFNQIK